MAMRVNDLSRDIPLGCTSATRVCFIGDSFATRFGKYCSAHAIVNGGFDLDVICWSVMARGGARLSFARDAALDISRLNATKVILQRGGNDLNNHCCQPDQLARDILHIARQLILHDGVTKVAICQLCHRYPPSYQRSRSTAALRHPLRCGYNELVDTVNVELRRLISLFPKIHFWKHRGMLFDYQSLVSDDGVHLSPVGDHLIYRSVRGAALFLSKH